MKTFKITEQTAQTILNYLADKPYREVFGIIEELRSIEEIVAEPEDGVPLEDDNQA